MQNSEVVSLALQRGDGIGAFGGALGLIHSRPLAGSTPGRGDGSPGGAFVIHLFPIRRRSNRRRHSGSGGSSDRPRLRSPEGDVHLLKGDLEDAARRLSGVGNMLETPSRTVNQPAA